jgi:uncharacterized ferredoxin-like protein
MTPKMLDKVQIFYLSKEIIDRFAKIMECISDEKNSVLIRQLAASCLQFTSFVAYVNDYECEE